MTRSRPARRRRFPHGPAPAVLVALLVMAAGCSQADASLDHTAIPDRESGLAAPAMPAAATPSSAWASVGGTDEVPWEPGVWAPPDEGVRPVGLWIPRIEVVAPMRGLGLDDDGSLEVPEEWDVAGWYTGAPRPGEPGPGVIAGHIDSRSGPAVFHRLDDLERGDLAHVVYEDGHVVTFVALESDRVAKDAFPTARVYGDTERPELRLITCGGRFDRSVGSYEDNVIVYGHVYAAWHLDAVPS